MTDESRYCPDCARLQADLDKAHAAYAHILLKGEAAYQQGHAQGASNVAVEIVLWLEGLALEHPQAALLSEIADRIMAGAYMPPEADKAL